EATFRAGVESDARFTTGASGLEFADVVAGEGFVAAVAAGCRTAGADTFRETFEGEASGVYPRTPDITSKARSAESAAIPIEVQSRESRRNRRSFTSFPRASQLSTAALSGSRNFILGSRNFILMRKARAAIAAFFTRSRVVTSARPQFRRV